MEEAEVAALSGGQRQRAGLAMALAQETPVLFLDEAFDRADPTFTRTAMSVFASFGFHMILATPFKLIQTLSPYVDGTSVEASISE